jgi:ABC-type lipoprotein release transport system permease subunit
MVPNTKDDSAEFGIWPSLVGIAFGVMIFVMMFLMATGFA